MNDQNRNHDTLKKMVEYCKDAESFTERCGYDFENYKSDTMFQYACNMCIMQIGELVHRLSDEFIEKNPQIPWHAIRAMRNLYAHEYEKIDLKIVWETLTKRIPELRKQLENMMDTAL